MIGRPILQPWPEALLDKGDIMRQVSVRSGEHAAGMFAAGVRWAVCGAMAWAVCGVFEARGSVFYSQGQAIPVDRVAAELLIELDGNRASSDVLRDLAAEGFTSQQVIPDLPNRFPYRKLFVNAADRATIQRLRQVAGVVAARPLYRLPGTSLELITTGEVVAKFPPGTTVAAAHTLAGQYGARVVEPIVGLPQVYVLQPNDESVADAFDVAAALTASGRVVFSHPSILMKDLLRVQQAPDPDDLLFPWQWHLENTGQIPGATPGADVKAREAWQFTMGQNAIVGINDSAVHWRHEDLVDNFLIGFDYFENDGDPSPGESWAAEGHGTSVAGLIAARANTVGVRGVAPLSQFTFAKWGSTQFGGYPVTDIDIARSFVFHETNGAMVINNSWGSGGVILPTIPTASLLLPNVVSEAIDRVATEGRGGRGVLVMFASGNASMLISFGNIYASMPNVMAIGATLRNDLITCYSDFGPEQSVVAPGGGFGLPRSLGGGYPLASSCFEADMATVDIDESQFPAIDPVTGQVLPRPRGFNPPTRFVGGVEVPDLEVIDFPNTAYTYRFNGTSSACPVAAGVAALVFSISDTYTAEQVRNIIEHTADKINVPNETFDSVTGHNERYGHGRVNALRAVQAAIAGHTWPSVVSDIQTIGSESTGLLLWTNPATDVASVLIARSSTGRLDWTPTDGIEYTVGQQVAPGVVIVLNSIVERLDQDLSSLPAGQYEYGLFVRNGASFYSWGRRTNFRSGGASTVPRASIVPSTTLGRAPLNVHFAGGAISTTGLDGLFYRWDFGDGATAFQRTAGHVYEVPGEYFARLTVTNDRGEAGDSIVRIVVTPASNQPPHVTVQATPVSGRAPLPVLFEAFGTDVDGQVVKYEWDFDDGTPRVTGRLVEHVFLDAGTYNVEVLVTDDQGATAINGVIITVTSPSATAADTDPPDTLGGTPPCAAGLGPAILAAVTGLVILRLVRREKTGPPRT